jgi:hypothetical protein
MHLRSGGQVPSKYLLPEDRVIRYVPWGKLLKDEDDNVLGTTGAAFQLREGEEYLSVTWCEYFEGEPDASMRCAVESIRASDLVVKPKGGFAVAAVGAIDQFMKFARRRLRFVHEAVDDNPAHTAVRGWVVDDIDLLDRLAEDVWSRVHLKPEIDAIPPTQCAASARGMA